MTGASPQDANDESPYIAPRIAASKGSFAKMPAVLWSLKVISPSPQLGPWWTMVPLLHHRCCVSPSRPLCILAHGAAWNLNHISIILRRTFPPPF